MINLYDVAYGLGIAVSAPLWMLRFRTRHKVLLALGQRMGYLSQRQGDAKAILIHAVSLGEMNATRELVKQLQAAEQNLHIVITTTTVTGYDRGRQLYAGITGVTLTRFPLDFSTAINRLLDATRPSLIVLMEGEIWPNFLKQCESRKIPVILVNGRVSQSAFRRYRRVKFITSSMLRRISAVCAQDSVYADRFIQLGAPPDRVQITGTMKFDTARLGDRMEGDQQLAVELGLDYRPGPVWVCGSTGPGEEVLLLTGYRNLLQTHPTLRLVIVPRKPERFDEVAGFIQAAGFDLLRRSTHQPSINAPVILGDTMGELRKFYSLADVVFVGRSLIDLGSRQRGSDMIEPAALGKPVAVGPWTQNFAEVVRLLSQSDGLVEIHDIHGLTSTIDQWLNNPESARGMGKRAQDVVRVNRGATARHVELILSSIGA